MSRIDEYLTLQSRIQKYEAEYPNLVVLAFDSNRIAVSSVSIARQIVKMPLEKVIYKKKSDEIWLVLAQGNCRNKVWNTNLLDVGVDPVRPRMDGQPARVIFEEVDH